jgi:D-methionine transport system ATP-binding protein
MSDRVTNSILRLDRVSCQANLSSTYLLQDISFTINQGEKVAVVGASGAGKTSLLRLLNRLSTPNRGKIYLEETAYEQIPVVRLRQQVVLMPQEPKLLGMNVREALIYPLRLQKLSAAESLQRIDTICERLFIPNSWLEKQELQLSLGQRQLVAIARSLVMQPKILLLDEPLSALDMGTSNRLLTALDRLVKDLAMTIIMVNHQLSAMVDFAERILYLKTGFLESDLTANSINWRNLEGKLLTETENEDLDWK